MRTLLIGFVAGTIFGLSLLGGGLYAFDSFNGGFFNQPQRDQILQQQQMQQQQDFLERNTPKYRQPC